MIKSYQSDLHQEKRYNKLIKQYEGLMYKIASDYYLPAGNLEDLLQEARIALTRAHDSYETSHGVPFVAYAALCIRRQLGDHVKKQLREKHQLLNQSDSLEQARYRPPAREPDPETELLAQESLAALQKIARETLSEFERDVLEGYLAGETYKVIAEKLDCTEKSVDNALSRIRGKIARELQENQLSLNSFRFLK